MPIEMTCPECLAKLTVGDDKAGLRVRCRECGAVVAIPNAAGYTTVFEQTMNCADRKIWELFQENYQTAGSWDDGYALAAPAGTYMPNKYGLSEMLGNVWEYCQDTWQPKYDAPASPDAVAVDPVRRNTPPDCAIRGASYYFNQLDQRACRREVGGIEDAQSDLGFRVLREITL